MIIGIDASNLRFGGAKAYLSELLKEFKPRKHDFKKIIVWSNHEVLMDLPDKKWLLKKAPPWLQQTSKPFFDKKHVLRVFWQTFLLPWLLAHHKCDLLFSPGGICLNPFRPMVTISQNLLPFQKKEAARYGLSMARIRLVLLRMLQNVTFSRADKVIFLNLFARDTVMKDIGQSLKTSVIIPHGINKRFFLKPKRLQKKNIKGKVFKIIYVSTFDLYKHQDNVALAVNGLIQQGFPLQLQLIGPTTPSGLKVLKNIQALPTFQNKKILCLGAVPNIRLPKIYQRADLKIFASTCENLPIILLEAMAAGLPICCSRLPPMTTILGSAASYFNPEDTGSIQRAIKRVYQKPFERWRMARESFAKAQSFSWVRCADTTMHTFHACLTTRREKK